MINQAGVRFRARTLASAALCVLTAIAWSAEGAQADDKNVDEQQPRAALGLDEVVVTAQRKQESSQRVPIAVSTVTADRALDLGIQDTIGLKQAIPGLNFVKIGNAYLTFLRGVGTNNATVNNENSVAIYLDGVYLPISPAGLFALNNIERVEVLKGPQGTLFGRNATGGVIQVVTRDPSRDPSVDMSLGYGNYDTISGTLYATGGVTEKVSVDVAVASENQREGWGRNLNTGEDQHRREYLQLRSKVLIDLGEKTQARLTLDYADNSGSGANRHHPPGVIGIDGDPTYVGPYNTSQGPESESLEMKSVALQIDHDFDSLRLVSITSGRTFDGFFRSDGDATPIVQVDSFINQEADYITQEVQLMSPADSSVDWIVGTFNYWAEVAYVPAKLTGLATGARPFIDRWAWEDVRSNAVYGQATVSLRENTRLTGGLRFTSEKKDYRGRHDSIAEIVIPESENELGFDKLTWRLALDHSFTSEVMGYISYNRGIKSGAFNMFNARFAGLPFEPEQLDAYEAGLKTELGNRARLNLAAFYYDYENLQVFEELAVGVNVTNAAKARIEGAEFELEANLAQDFTVTAAATYLDGKYLKYPNAQFINANGTSLVLGSAAGHRIIDTPQWSGNVGAIYRFGDFAAAANLYYSDEFFWTPDNRPRQPSYELLNANVVWSPSTRNNFEVRVWGRNLTDKEYYISLQEGLGGNGDNRYAAAPRTYGVTISASFR